MPNFLDLPLELREKVYHYLWNTAYNNTNGRVNFSGSEHIFLLNKRIKSEAEIVYYWENPNVLIKTNAPLESLLKNGPPMPSRCPPYPIDMASQMPATLVCDLNWAGSKKPEICFFVPSLMMKSFFKPFLMGYYHQIDFSNMSMKWTWQDPKTHEETTRTPTRVQKELLSHFILCRPVALPERTSEDKIVYDMVKKRHAAKLHKEFDRLAEAVRFKVLGNELYAQGQHVQAPTAGYSPCVNAASPAMNNIQQRIFEIKRIKDVDDYEYIIWEVGTMAGVQIVHQAIANSAMCYIKLEIWDVSCAELCGARLTAQMVIQCCMQAIQKVRARKGLPMSSTSHPSLEVEERSPAGKEYGKIYYRMAQAARAKDDLQEARALLKIAAAYLPNDQIIANELQQSAPRIAG